MPRRLPQMLKLERYLKTMATKRKHKQKRSRQQKGGYVGLAKAALTYGLPEIYNMVRSGVGSQNGNSAGSRASYMRFGLPLTKRYR